MDIMVTINAYGLYTYCVLLAVLCQVYEAVEYCHHEDFIASCHDNQVIVITSAKYGRMEMGKCITSDFGYMGCSVDVVDDVHGRCSGRRQCKIHVPDPVFDETKPCHKDLNNYLDVDYHCINVTLPEVEKCSQNTTNNLTKSGYLASIVTMETGCGNEFSPWLIQALPGQRINITLVDFRRSSGAYRTPVEDSRTEDNEDSLQSSSQILCKELAIVEEESIRTPLSSCEGSGIIDPGGTRYTSMGHEVTIYLRSRALDDEEHFVIKYDILGCPDIEANKLTWVTRDADKISIGCLSTDMTWHMTCVGTEWQGEAGNCSAGKMKDPRVAGDGMSLSVGASVIIILVVSGVVGILVLLVGLFCMKRYRARRALRSDIPLKDIRPLNQDEGYDQDVLYARNNAFIPTRIRFSKQRLARSKKGDPDHEYEYVWDMSGVTKGAGPAAPVSQGTPRPLRSGASSPEVCHCPEIHVHVHQSAEGVPPGSSQISKVQIQTHADTMPRVVATICRTPVSCRREGSDVTSPRTLRAIKGPATPSGCRKGDETSTSRKHVTATLGRRKASDAEAHHQHHHPHHQCTTSGGGGGGANQDTNGSNKRYWTLPVGRSAFKSKQSKNPEAKPRDHGDSTG